MLNQISTLLVHRIPFLNANATKRIFRITIMLATPIILVLVSVIAFVITATRVDAVKPAQVTAQFTCPADGLPDDYGDGVVVRNGLGQLEINRQWFGGFDALGSITTTGGATPTASINMQLIGSGDQGVNLRVRATASILYYFRIVPAIGEWPGTLRVRITRSGHIDTNSNSALNIGPNTKVGVTLCLGPIDVIGVADMSGKIGYKAFDLTSKFTMSTNIEYYINLYAMGDLNVFTGETTTISGIVDPIIEVDPDWIAAHPEAPPFIIQYSENFGPVIPTYTLSSTAQLGDYTGTIAGIPVTLDLLTEDGLTVLRTENTTLDAEGKFYLNNIEPGTYRVGIKPSHWLRKVTAPITVTDADLDFVIQ